MALGGVQVPSLFQARRRPRKLGRFGARGQDRNCGGTKIVGGVPVLTGDPAPEALARRPAFPGCDPGSAILPRFFPDPVRDPVRDPIRDPSAILPRSFRDPGCDDGNTMV
jgi:hypothetical protein